VRHIAFVAVNRGERRRIDSLSPTKARIARGAERRIEHAAFLEALGNSNHSPANCRQGSMQKTVRGDDGGKLAERARQRIAVACPILDGRDIVAGFAQRAGIASATGAEIENSTPGSRAQAFDQFACQRMRRADGALVLWRMRGA